MNTTSAVSLVVLLITGAASVFVGPVQDFWLAHQPLATAILSLWAALAHFLPSPTAAKQ